MLIAASDKLAKRILRDIKRTFATNPLLLEDFPEVCYPLRRLGNINNRAAGQTLTGSLTVFSYNDQLPNAVCSNIERAIMVRKPDGSEFGCECLRS
jgi:hypothetical protein